jgi:hypothetical protein
MGAGGARFHELAHSSSYREQRAERTRESVRVIHRQQQALASARESLVELRILLDELTPRERHAVNLRFGVDGEALPPGLRCPTPPCAAGLDIPSWSIRITQPDARNDRGGTKHRLVDHTALVALGRGDAARRELHAEPAGLEAMATREVQARRRASAPSNRKATWLVAPAMH